MAHAGINRVILSEAMGLPLEHLFRLDQNYGCLNIIDYFPDLAVVRLLNGGVNGAGQGRGIKPWGEGQGTGRPCPPPTPPTQPV